MKDSSQYFAVMVWARCPFVDVYGECHTASFIQEMS